MESSSTNSVRRRAVLQLTRIGEIRKPANTVAPHFTITRDGRWIAWSQLDHEDSDLMLLENFR